MATKKLSDRIRQQGSGVLGRQTWPVDPRPRIVPDGKQPTRSAAQQALRALRQEYQDH